ncbi:hypothetical protein ACFO6R_03805 [Eubacterium multiforme]|uniref:Uncharacterized protein n=1 Tax=Eubacterium multiforme TaxID=83339 RepID=A0ABT9UN85_9FIRM|nr:hypothetical protein [Eubacterium multiforme]MDQ0148113.1 hypothetical protein [Eubacterium multiforme]
MDLNLKKGKEKDKFNYMLSYYGIIIILTLMQIMVIGEFFEYDFKVNMFLGVFYTMIICFITQYFYISKNKVGTLFN